MILSVRISNYRSFRNEATFQMEATAAQAKSFNVVPVDLEKKSFRVLKTSLIYGANASGKTTLIRALHSLCSEVKGDYKDAGGDSVSMYDPFAFSKDSLEQPSLIEISFIAEGTRYVYLVRFSRNVILEERLDYYKNGNSRANVFSRDSQGRGMHTPRYASGLPAKDRPSFSIFPNKLLLSKFRFDTPHALATPAAMYLSNVEFANSYSPYMKSRLWSEAKSLLDKPGYEEKLNRLLNYVDFGIDRYRMGADKEINSLRLIHKTVDRNCPNELPIGEESLGTSTLFFLGPKIIQSLETGHPLFVDELDTSFHSFISEFIIKMFSSEKINRKHAQLVIVTHDITLMQENLLRRDQIWFAEKNDNGESELFSLSDFDGVREDTPFAKWYLASKFGAVPTLEEVENLFQ